MGWEHGGWGEDMVGCGHGGSCGGGWLGLWMGGGHSGGGVWVVGMVFSWWVVLWVGGGHNGGVVSRWVDMVCGVAVFFWW